MGLLYLFELPFILFGIYKLIFSDINTKTKLTIFAWILLVPIPASITTGVPHAVRTLNFLPTWQILSALGLIFVWQKIINLKLKTLNLNIGYIIAVLFFMFAIFNFSYYLNQYFVQQNYYNSSDWQYGYKQTVEAVSKLENKFDKIVVSNKGLDQSYIFFLFYLRYPPSEFQKSGSNTNFAKFTFRQIDWEKDSKIKNVLYVGTPEEIQGDKYVIHTINNLDGTVAIKIAGVR